MVDSPKDNDMMSPEQAVVKDETTTAEKPERKSVSFSATQAAASNDNNEDDNKITPRTPPTVSHVLMDSEGHIFLEPNRPNFSERQASRKHFGAMTKQDTIRFVQWVFQKISMMNDSWMNWWIHPSIHQSTNHQK